VRLRHIEVFHAVYSCGSITRAAEVLNVSQPSVSKVLAHAEQQLGYALFDRVRGKLIPTPEADKLYVHVTQVNDSVDRLRRIAANIGSMESGMIRIAATTAFGIDFLPGAIAEFREKHKDILFSVEILRHEELAAALLDSKIDLALAFDPNNMPGIRGELLAYGRFVVLAPPGIGLDQKGPLKLEDLAALPFIRLDNQGPLDRLLNTHIETSDVEFRTTAVAGSYQLAKSLVSHGVGVCIADEITARSRSDEDIVMRPLDPGLKFRVAALHTDQEPVSLVCRHFIDHLEDCLQRFLQ
jgi:DNA-binding transcriptional LysR family regulator